MAGLAVGIAFVAIITVFVPASQTSNNNQNNNILVVELEPYNHSSFPYALSVYITQKFVLTEPSDSFYVYEIESYDYRPPSSIRAVYDDSGNPIKLRSYGLTHDLNDRKVSCPSGEDREIVYHDHGMPLVSNVTGTIFYKYPFAVLSPIGQDNNLEAKQYSLQFGSFHAAKIALPQGAEILSIEEEKCPVSDVGNFTDAFFYDVAFVVPRADLPLNRSPANQSEDATAGEDSEPLSKLAASMLTLSPTDRSAVESANELDIVQAYLGRFPEAAVTSVQHQNYYSGGPEPTDTVYTISYSYSYADETSKFKRFRDLHVMLVEIGGSMQSRISLACGSSLGGSAIAEINSINSTKQAITLCPLPYEK